MLFTTALVWILWMLSCVQKYAVIIAKSCPFCCVFLSGVFSMDKCLSTLPGKSSRWQVIDMTAEIYNAGYPSCLFCVQNDTLSLCCVGCSFCGGWKILYRNASTQPMDLKVKVAHTRLPILWFRSWSQFLTVSLQVTRVINLVVGCHYFPPGLQLLPQPLRAVTNFAAWLTEARWVWTVCLRLLPDSVATSIWIRALLCLSPAR